jgi:hypothetical protein
LLSHDRPYFSSLVVFVILIILGVIWKKFPDGEENFISHLPGIPGIPDNLAGSLEKNYPISGSLTDIINE